MDGWPYPCMSDPGGRDRVAFFNLCCSFEIFALHAFKATRDWTFGAHDHPMFELNYMIKGQQRVAVGDSFLLLQKGDILLMPPGMSHSASAGAEGFSGLCFCFDIDLPLFRDALIRSRCIHLSKESDLSNKLHETLDQLFHIAITSGTYPVQQLRISALIHQTLADLAETVFTDKRTEPSVTPAMQRLAEITAEEIHRLVKVNSQAEMEKIHLADVAKKGCISLSHCTRIFQKVYGMSPRDYLSMVRQREAKSLLLMPALPISEVARRIGYANDSDFSRQFKRWTGMSPKEFRLEACKGFKPCFKEIFPFESIHPASG